jgi:hypothetical protein
MIRTPTKISDAKSVTIAPCGGKVMHRLAINLSSGKIKTQPEDGVHLCLAVERVLHQHQSNARTGYFEVFCIV